MKIGKETLTTDATFYVEDGDTIEIDKKGEIIKFSCCNCGSTHDFAFKVFENGNIGMKVTKELKTIYSGLQEYEMDGNLRTIV